MRAITQHSFGGPDVLQPAEADPPDPLPTEVLVRVAAAGVNPVDGVVRSGAFPLLGPPPFILGWDISGTVESVVPGVNRFHPGDEVFGMPFFPRPGNAYAEYVAVPSRQLARKPDHLSHPEAAALPMAGLTAWQSLIEIADIRAGDRVLIHGAGGGVGHLAVQIAKSRRAYVVGTASAGKHDYLTKLGADQLIDYHRHDFTTQTGDLAIVFDLIAGGYAERSIPLLRPGGLLITAIERSNHQLAQAVQAAGRRFAGISVEPDPVGLEALAALTTTGQLHPHISHTIPLHHANHAHRLLTTNPTGKIILTL